jgi:hypothetical protein
MGQPICRRLVEEGMDLLTFANQDSMRDVQTFFLGTIPPARFDFIGITERFGESIERFNSIFGTDLDRALSVNANPGRTADSYRSLVGTHAYDEIAALNAGDMSLYATALSTYR